LNLRNHCRGVNELLIKCQRLKGLSKAVNATDEREEEEGREIRVCNLLGVDVVDLELSFDEGYVFEVG
jgi:hypothetical protein